MLPSFKIFSDEALVSHVETAINVARSLRLRSRILQKQWLEAEVFLK